MKSLTNGLTAIHPGEFLKEILDELGLMQAAFAEAIGISPMRVSHLLKGQRPVTAELALRLGRALSQTPEYWLKGGGNSQYPICGRTTGRIAALLLALCGSPHGAQSALHCIPPAHPKTVYWLFPPP